MRRLLHTVAIAAGGILAANTMLAQSGASGTPPGQSLDAVVDRAVKAYAGARTARGSFEQTIRRPTGRAPLESRGTFQQEFPNKVSLRFSNPPDEAIVSDGSTIWLYTPSATPGVVTRCPVEAVPLASLNIVAEFVTDPRSKYDMSDAGADTIGGRATRAVTVVPRSSAKWFTKATVWIDEQNGLIRQFETNETGGLIRRIRLTSVEMGAPVNASQFTFRVPSGVKIDQSC